MLEMFRRAGIRNYSIWQTGDTLFGYYECDDLKTALAVQMDAPVSARWRAYMRDVIRTGSKERRTAASGTGVSL